MVFQGRIAQLTIIFGIVFCCACQTKKGRMSGKLNDIISRVESNNVLLQLLVQEIVPNIDLQLFNAVEAGNLKRTYLLLSAGASTEYQRGTTEEKPIILAAKKNQTSILDLLLNFGANPNAYDARGLTALHWTSWLNFVDSAKLLLQKGAAVNTQDDEGYTPLLRAAQRGHIHIIKLLLDNGADIKAAQDFGEGVLHLAVNNDQYDAVNILINHGADVRQRNNNGKMPLDIAIEKKRHDIENLIRSTLRNF